MKPDTSRRPTHCPRCSAPVDRIRPVVVRLPEEGSSTVSMEPATPEMEMTFETERWVQYEPCGHEVPPEEHNEVVS